MREVATINTRAQYYLQGLTPPPPAKMHIRIDWAAIDLPGRAERFVSDLLACYIDGAIGGCPTGS